MLSTLDAIVFDFDGVLNRNYGPEGFRWCRNLEADFGITHAAFTAALFDDAFTDVLIGKTDLHHALEKILPALGCHKPVADFTAYWFEQDLALCDDMYALLAELRARGMRCVIGTNNEPRRAAYLWQHALAGRVDALFTAGLMGVAKPDLAFFERIAEDLGIDDPGRILLIDDIAHNVDGARAAGWQAIQYGDFAARTLGDPAALRVTLGLG